MDRIVVHIVTNKDSSSWISSFIVLACITLSKYKYRLQEAQTMSFYQNTKSIPFVPRRTPAAS